jgi:hypothetical protein
MTMWLLGPDSGYSTAPTDVEKTIDQLLLNEEKVVDGSNISTFTSITAKDWSRSLLFGETVKFLQQAIEWENLLYFLYPYFWGSDPQARDKFLFEHPDPEHQNFVRAGYARVVVTVRPGFEASSAVRALHPISRSPRKSRTLRTPTTRGYRRLIRKSTRGRCSIRSSARPGSGCR